MSRAHRYITIVLRSEWLTNWRVKAVYEPRLIRLLSAGGSRVWNGSDKDKIAAERIVEFMRRREAVQAALKSGALEERLRAITAFIGCSRGEVLGALERVPDMSDTQAIVEEITRWALAYWRGFREDVHQEEI